MSDTRTQAATSSSIWQPLAHYACLIVLAMICLLPIWVMISTSFKNEIVIFDGKPIWFFFTPTLENYEYLVGRGKFDRYLSNSIIVAVSSTLLTLLFGGFCAYGVGAGALLPVDISTAQVHDGKLYLNLNHEVLSEFDKDREGFISKAVEKFPVLVKENAA